LGKAIEDSGIDRSDIFLSTKLWPKDYGKDKTRAAALGSMRKLDTDYLDLYMLHWPVCAPQVIDQSKCLAETWRELELMLDEGKMRSIGVSNFQVITFENILLIINFHPHPPKIVESKITTLATPDL
jgi:diketogulonate reductase-like aldo/keto reductase